MSFFSKAIGAIKSTVHPLYIGKGVSYIPARGIVGSAMGASYSYVSEDDHMIRDTVVGSLAGFSAPELLHSVKTRGQRVKRGFAAAAKSYVGSASV